ncbi:uncharacterized protein ACN2A1_000737 isoform 2-T2 [Glossina fuscipes fuscipes]
MQVMSRAVEQPVTWGRIPIHHPYTQRTFKIILDNMECNPDMNVMECRKNFDVAKCIVNIKESLEELKPHKLKSCWKKLWAALTVEIDEESVQVQTLTANIAEIGRNYFTPFFSAQTHFLYIIELQTTSDKGFYITIR